jgi:thiol-disulfide isomerase/thioredoxin
LRGFFSRARLWDVLALLVVAFALWRIFIAPHALEPAGKEPAPHAVFARLDGDEFRVASERGRLLFLDFFASWCEPCTVELPLVESWARAHPSAVVVPVDVGEPAAVVRGFARRYRLHGVALDPQSSARALFGVQGFPTIVVIDPTGHIRAKWEGLNPAIALAMTDAQKRLASASAPSTPVCAFPKTPPCLP